MNTLGHLVLGYPDPERMLGQFLGDFIKGPLSDSHLPQNVLVGIQDHRRVDALGDMHEFTCMAKSWLPPELRRYAGIVLDVFSDYLLHETWATTATCSLEELIAAFDAFIASSAIPVPPRAQRYAQIIQDYHLLEISQDFDELPDVLNRIGNRLRRPAPLQEVLQHLQQHEAQLITAFPNFFADMTEACENVEAFHGFA